MLDFSKYNKFRTEAIKASNNSVEKLRYDLSMFMSGVKRTFKDTYEHASSDMPIEFSYPLDTKTTDGRNFNLYFFTNGEATSYVVSPDSLSDVMYGKFETAYDVGHITSDQIAYGIKYENNIYQFPAPVPSSFRQNKSDNCSVDFHSFLLGNRSNPHILLPDPLMLSETIHVCQNND